MQNEPAALWLRLRHGWRTSVSKLSSARLEQETGERGQTSLDDDEVLSESSTERGKRMLRFKTISEPLTSTTLGTS